jgi:hypothetical protein
MSTKGFNLLGGIVGLGAFFVAVWPAELGPRPVWALGLGLVLIAIGAVGVFRRVGRESQQGTEATASGESPARRSG